MCQFQYCCPHSATTTTVWLNFWRKRITPHHSSYDHKSIYMSNEWICVQHTSHTRTTAHSNQAHQAHTCTKHTTGLDKFCVCAMCHVPCVCVCVSADFRHRGYLWDFALRKMIFHAATFLTYVYWFSAILKRENIQTWALCMRSARLKMWSCWVSDRMWSITAYKYYRRKGNVLASVHLLCNEDINRRSEYSRKKSNNMKTLYFMAQMMIG